MTVLNYDFMSEYVGNAHARYCQLCGELSLLVLSVLQATALGLSWWVLVGTVGLYIEVVTMGLYTIIHRGVGSVGLYVVDSVGRHTNHTSPLLALPRPMCSD